MALYLIDKKYGDLALDLVEMDASAVIVFIQDGVYLKYAQSNGRKIFYVSEDVELRGIKDLPENAEITSYDNLVDMMTQEKVYNFI
jgi:sulfur transfer complex TusBCD TusB component (DsrH family)